MQHKTRSNLDNIIIKGTVQHKTRSNLDNIIIKGTMQHKTRSILDNIIIKGTVVVISSYPAVMQCSGSVYYRVHFKLLTFQGCQTFSY